MARWGRGGRRAGPAPAVTPVEPGFIGGRSRELRRRPTRLTGVRTKALLVTLAAAIAAGCGEGPDKPREPGSLSASARITCGRDGARVLTAAVGTQPDGLHLELTNETARKVHVTIEQDRYTAAGGTRLLAPQNKSGGATRRMGRYVLLTEAICVSRPRSSSWTPKGSGSPPS